MEVFNTWIGHWKGEGTMQQGPGTAKKSSVDENIEFKLDGMILATEGTGKVNEGTAEEKIVHHAFAILSYDQTARTYKFKSYIQDGGSTDAWFENTGENKYQMGL